MAMLDRRSDRAPYRQIADHLRADIEEGRLGPGDKLPSERELAERYDVERATAHRAVQELHLDGLVVAYAGRGVFVAEPWAPRRIMRNPHPVSRVLGLDPEEDDEPAVEFVLGAMERSVAPAQITELLDLATGTQVPTYSWEIADANRTILIVGKTFFSPALADVLPALGGDGPELAGGLYDQLEALELTLRHDDVISARMPRPEEVRHMDLDAGIPLITILRVTTNATTGEALEVQETLLPASRNELRYMV